MVTARTQQIKEIGGHVAFLGHDLRDAARDGGPDLGVLELHRRELVLGPHRVLVGPGQGEILGRGALLHDLDRAAGVVELGRRGEDLVVGLRSRKCQSYGRAPFVELY